MVTVAIAVKNNTVDETVNGTVKRINIFYD